MGTDERSTTPAKQRGHVLLVVHPVCLRADLERASPAMKELVNAKPLPVLGAHQEEGFLCGDPDPLYLTEDDIKRHEPKVLLD